ncbi:MAG TPA: TetR/AcrR family transcriptional regulator [Gemmatimonadaceae bacterium]|nr:TetR/AcrR family transcriptional regulator [Gemmatimonadaceae bacterium]
MPRVSPAAVAATGENAPSTAEHILDVAGALFYQRGFAAAGVDLIVRESGVAKMTLYRHYPSKDDLIAAWLERADAQFTEHFERWAGPAGAPARDRLLGVFTGLQKLVSSPTCLGCPFLLAASEFPEPATRAHKVARRHKQRVRERLREMAAGVAHPDARALGDQLLLLMDGAFMAARLFGAADHPGRHVRDAAAALLDATGGAARRAPAAKRRA